MTFSRWMGTLVALGLAVTSVVANAQGNTEIERFNAAKKLLETKVYHDHRVTFYCQAPFDKRKNITLPQGFTTEKHAKRAHRVEWEHVVPAENFGRSFEAWRDGHDSCVRNDKPYKGRACAQKVEKEFRYMEADMYNLYPAIGAVNATRSNFRFARLGDVPSSFGSCPMTVQNGRVQPPTYTRGAIARTMLYMADAYPKFRLSRQDQKLYQAWDRLYPVDQWECIRASRIEQIQKNRNRFVKQACQRSGLWP